jgi:hypothetical protein
LVAGWRPLTGLGYSGTDLARAGAGACFENMISYTSQHKGLDDRWKRWVLGMELASIHMLTSADLRRASVEIIHERIEP